MVERVFPQPASRRRPAKVIVAHSEGVVFSPTGATAGEEQMRTTKMVQEGAETARNRYHGAGARTVDRARTLGYYTLVPMLPWQESRGGAKWETPDNLVAHKKYKEASLG